MSLWCQPSPDTIIPLFVSLEASVRRDEQYPPPSPPPPLPSRLYLRPNPQNGEQPDPADRVSGLE